MNTWITHLIVGCKGAQMHEKKVISLLAFVVLLLSLILFGTTAALAESSEMLFREFGVQEFNSSTDAPDFSVKNVNGEEIQLHNLRGKVVLLTFFTAG